MSQPSTAANRCPEVAGQPATETMRVQPDEGTPGTGLANYPVGVIEPPASTPRVSVAERTPRLAAARVEVEDGT